MWAAVLHRKEGRRCRCGQMTVCRYSNVGQSVWCGRREAVVKEGRERQRRSIANTLFVGEAGARGEIPMLYSAFEVANTVNHSIEIALCTIVHFYLALSAQDAGRLGFLRRLQTFLGQRRQTCARKYGNESVTDRQ